MARSRQSSPTSPDSNSDLTPRGLLEYLDRGQNALILRLLWENPVRRKNQLAERDDELCTSIVARTVKKHRVKGLVREHPGRGQYELTIFGELVIINHQIFEDIIGEDGIEMIAKSPSIISILRHLAAGPKSVNTLVEADDIDIGERMLSQHRAELESLGWIERSPPYSVSKVGQIVIVAYQSYIESSAQIIAQCEFLQSVDEELPANTC